MNEKDQLYIITWNEDNTEYTSEEFTGLSNAAVFRIYIDSDVYDGDTVQLNPIAIDGSVIPESSLNWPIIINGEKLDDNKVRFAAVDTPESVAGRGVTEKALELGLGTAAKDNFKYYLLENATDQARTYCDVYLISEEPAQVDLYNRGLLYIHPVRNTTLVGADAASSVDMKNAFTHTANWFQVRRGMALPYRESTGYSAKNPTVYKMLFEAMELAVQERLGIWQGINNGTLPYDDIFAEDSQEDYEYEFNTLIDNKVILRQGDIVVGEPERDNLRMGTVLSITEVCDRIGQFIDILREEGEILSDHDDLLYAPAYPDIVRADFKDSAIKEVQTPSDKIGNIITYRISKHEPGSLERHPFTGRRVRKGRWSNEYYDDETDEKVTEFTRWFDNLVQFDCFAKTDKEALWLRQNFERMIETYGLNLFKGGISKGPIHWGWWEDTELVNRLRIMRARSVRYYIRTEQTSFKKDNIIKKINILFGAK